VMSEKRESGKEGTKLYHCLPYQILSFHSSLIYF
jgi:hypothetical protein